MATTALERKLLRRRRVDRDRRVDRRSLALLGRGRGPGRPGWGARGGARTGRRPSAWSPPPADKRAEMLVARRRSWRAGRGRRPHDLPRGRQAAEGGPREAARVTTSRSRAVEARRLAGEGADGRQRRRRGQARHDAARADGVVGAISPFNFPLNLVAHKVAPAIAAGCPVVLKPASPRRSRRPAGRARGDAGLPGGSQRRRWARRRRSATWSSTPRRVISFTGRPWAGSSAGASRARRCARARQLHAGDREADADLDAAASKLAAANAFTLAGSPASRSSASMCARVLHASSSEFFPQGRRAGRRRPDRRRDGCRPGHRRRQPRPDAGLDRRGPARRRRVWRRRATRRG